MVRVIRTVTRSIQTFRQLEEFSLIIPKGIRYDQASKLVRKEILRLQNIERLKEYRLICSVELGNGRWYSNNGKYFLRQPPRNFKLPRLDEYESLEVLEEEIKHIKFIMFKP